MGNLCSPIPEVALAATLLLGLGFPSAAGAASLPLPTNACSAGGWQVVRQVELPQFTVDQRRIGGFSALRYTPADDRLWLLSDLPSGTLSLWRGLSGPGALRLQRLVELGPGPGGNLGEMDGEGLVPDNWEALAEGPPLPDGRSSLVLVSDDNLSPLQASRLALLTADRPACRERP